jgi:hypothetical protein
VILLYVQIGAAVLGLTIAAGLFLDTWRTARALSRSGQNGPRWALVRGDVVDEALRIVAHLLILAPSILLYLFLRQRGLSYEFRIGSAWFMVMTLLLAGGSINRWLTRRALWWTLGR